MSWENHRGVQTFSAARRQQPHQSFDFTVLNPLQAVKPQEMMRPEKLLSGPELLNCFIILLPERTGRDVNYTCVDQQVGLRSLALLALAL